MWSLRIGAAVAAFSALVWAAPATGLDANDVVRRAAERQREADRRGLALAFDETEVTTELDEAGRSRAAERRLYASVLRGISIAERELLAVDGRSPTERERRRVREEDEQRSRTRAARGAGADDDLRSGRLDLTEMLSRFDFRFVREELLDGRPSWVIAFEPRGMRVSRTMRDRVLDEFRGLAWIDVVDLQASRVEGRLARPIRVAAGLALNLQSIEILYEARPLRPGVWAPCLEVLRIDARAALVIPFRKEFRLEFSGYRDGVVVRVAPVG